MSSNTPSNTRSDASRSITPPSANPHSKPTASHTALASSTSLSSAPPLKTLIPRKNISQFENFVMSALAPSMAVVFTLPFDTVKVRMQLQGEVSLVRDATGKPMRRVAQKVYKTSLDCLIKTFKYEGIRGLEKGLTPSILKESSKNVFRLGMYDPILNVLHPTDDKRSSQSAPAWKRMLAGGMCGAMGAVSANPFELVKTRLQSSAAGKIAVGNQHGYNSVTSAFRRIIAGEGVAGLYRGSMISVYRGILGSATNLSSYTLLRDRALKDGYKDGVPLDMACSLISAFVSVLFMNPLDVVRTRLYNAKTASPSVRQGTLTTISNIVATEGWMALYRGFSTHFMRIGPHFCLTFVFLEELKRAAHRLHDRQYQRELQQFKKEELFRSTAELKMLKA